MRLGEWIVNVDKASRPYEAMIEVTMKCNLKCIHCFRNNLMEDLGEMELSDFKRVLSNAERAGIKKVVFSGWGEPLVHNDILEMLRLCKERGFTVLLNTNGTLLREYANDLVKLGVDEIVVSVDAVSHELYESIRVGGEIDVVTEGLIKIKELMLGKGIWKPSVSIQFTLNRRNVKELRKLIEYARIVGATHVFISNVIPLSTKSEEKIACYLSDDCLYEVKRLGMDLAKISLETKVLITLPSMSISVERSCPFITKKALFIRWDGGVSPCIYYSHNWRSAFMGVERRIKAVIFGNALKQDLRDIWLSDDYVRFRFRTYFFSMPSCLDCPLVNYCDYTLSNENDCWGNSPTCSHCPYSHGMVRCPL